MNEVRTKTFKSGNSVALRLPKKLGVGEGVEFIVRKVGDVLEATPEGKRKMTPRELVARLREIGPPPGPPLKREKIIFPKRRGL